MRKLVNLLVSFAAGLETGLATYEQLGAPVPIEPARPAVGFKTNEPPRNFVNPPPAPWVNGEK